LNILCKHRSNIVKTCVDVIRNSSKAIKFPWFHMHVGERFRKICTHVQPSIVSVTQTRRAQFYCRTESLVCSNIWRAADWDFRALRSTRLHMASPFRNDDALIFARSRTDESVQRKFSLLKTERFLSITIFKFI